MCRFALIKSKKPINPVTFLNDFAAMAQHSRTPEGDRQADGWGITLKTENGWQLRRSVRPIWQDKKVFTSFPKTKFFLIHARSASFPQEKGILEYNQPYVYENLAFVFNGMISGVKLNKVIPGTIGAQKIFSLIKEDKETGLTKKMTNVFTLLKNTSRSFTGFNVGLSDGKNIAALCAFNRDKNYFSLYHHQSPDISIIASEPVGEYTYSTMRSGEGVTF